MEGARRITNVVLVLAVMASTQGFLVVHGAFYLRQDFIAQHLCVNRDRPELSCKGRCYLRKQVEQQEQRQQDQNANPSVPFALDVVLVAEQPVAPPPVRSFVYPVVTDDPVGEGAVLEVFHPPPPGTAPV